MTTFSAPIANSHKRFRRLRKNTAICSLVKETFFSPEHLIQPLFLTQNSNEPQPITALPGIYRLPLENALEEIQQCIQLGIQNIMLFPVINPTLKTPCGQEAYHHDGFLQKCIYTIHQTFPNINLFVDVALDPFTTHGHDGILNAHGEIENDTTVEALCKQALSYAQSGAQFVCPSDMMDGRIGAIRQTLDFHGYTYVGILAYSAKYASALYGPFREALSSGSQKIDKTSYQLDYANTKQAILETLLDIDEGADIVMVKPGTWYLDIVSQLSQKIQTPIAVYHVSGEYTMLKLAAAQNIIDEKRAVFEVLTSMRRAGAQMIVTYYAKWAAQHLCQGKNQ